MKTKKNPNVDLRGWSNIFFLSGLVIMLFISWRMVEWKSYDRGDQTSEVILTGEDLETDIPITQQLELPPPPPPPPAMAQQVFEVVEDNLEVEETLIESSELDQDGEIMEVINIEDIEDVEEETIADVPFAVIEAVPIYPGCEGEQGNNARRKCMSDNISLFVQERFNNELAGDLGLEGMQKIYVQFKIDHKGDVVNVKARAPHPGLEREALRVVNQLPKMVPGKQRGKPVGVLYALPILFKVETTK